MGDHFSGYPALSGLKGGSLPKFSKKNLLKVKKQLIMFSMQNTNSKSDLTFSCGFSKLVMLVMTALCGW